MYVYIIVQEPKVNKHRAYVVYIPVSPCTLILALCVMYKYYYHSDVIDINFIVIEGVYVG